ncbi:MAG: site-specific DNA-methyltransferase [Bacteroidales bacterium]|nr:site-specific DNA-methyltransferase [Bacteroidales bacterium]
MKMRAPRNQTLTLTDEEFKSYEQRLISLHKPSSLSEIIDKTICQDISEALFYLPEEIADILIIDPPYNLRVKYGDLQMHSMKDEDYLKYVMSWLPQTLKLLKPDGTVYVCCDWKSSNVIYQALVKCGIHIRTRITWQREKGRGAKENWKNAMEDIWYGVKDLKHFYFDVEAVKQKKRVIAPYRNMEGLPKDWEETEEGRFRLTHPSNFWDDISIPYWSMPENTDHPTQKPEKLIAKLLLASCPKDGIVFDPFAGSGTTQVVAKKLGRHYVGVEVNKEYACWTEKRLSQAEENKRIQGFQEGVFWDRNSGK